MHANFTQAKKGLSYMILIVGGTGFIGKNLCAILHQKGLHAVTLSRRPDTSFLENHAPSIGSLRTEDTSDKFLSNVETVFYLASQSNPATCGSIHSEYQLNINPAASLMDRVVNLNPGVRVVFLSSGGTIYGPHHSKPISEDTALNPSSSYAWGKIAIENYLKFLANAKPMSFSILRASNPVGRWHLDSKQGFIGAAISKIKAGLPVPIFGDGSSTRDYLDVEDLVNAMIMLYKKPEISHNTTWNVGLGKGASLSKVLKCIEKAKGSNVRIERMPARSSDLAYNVLDCTAIQSQLGWRPNSDLQSIINKVWDSA